MGWFRQKGDTAGSRVAVLGAFRSGTNYLRALLDGNYRVATIYHAYGWKHGFVPVHSPETDLVFARLPGIFVTKVPFAWLVSVYDYHCTIGRNIAAPTEWSAFLREPFTVFVQRRGEGPEYRFATPLDYWNGLNWNYLTASRSGYPLHHVRYEATLRDPEGMCGSIAEALQLARKTTAFYTPNNSVNRMADRARRDRPIESDTAFDRSRYEGAAWLTRFSPDDMAFSEGRLDREVAGALGYDQPVGVAP
jgi:hypothetical protein